MVLICIRGVSMPRCCAKLGSYWQCLCCEESRNKYVLFFRYASLMCPAICVFEAYTAYEKIFIGSNVL